MACLHPASLSNRGPLCHLVRGAFRRNVSIPSCSYGGGIIRYQPTSASAAAWRGFMCCVYQNANACNSNYRSCAAMFHKRIKALRFSRM